MRNIPITYIVFNHHRLNNAQLEAQLEIQTKRMRSIDTRSANDTEMDTLFDVLMDIKEIKKVLKSREPRPTPFKG